MTGCWKKVFFVLSLVGACGFLVLCSSGAGYLDRAEAPDAIELGIGVSTPKLSFWMGIRGTSIPDSRKDHPLPTVNGLSY